MTSSKANLIPKFASTFQPLIDQEGYLVNQNDGRFDIEDKIEAGDIGLFYASLRHGLDVIDPDQDPDPLLDRDLSVCGALGRLK